MFLDLKGAFDNVDRNLSRIKLINMGIDSKLLHLIRGLYSNMVSQVRYTLEGNITNEFPTNKGVKQGCGLAPTLFNLFKRPGPLLG